RRLTRRGVDARSVRGATRYVDHLLVRLAAGIDPALDDLHALEVGARKFRSARILECEHGEARARACVARTHVAAHRRSVRIRAREQIGTVAAHAVESAGEEAH